VDDLWASGAGRIELETIANISANAGLKPAGSVGTACIPDRIIGAFGHCKDGTSHHFFGRRVTHGGFVDFVAVNREAFGLGKAVGFI